MNAFRKWLLAGCALIWLGPMAAQTSSATYTLGNLDIEGVLATGQSSCSDTLTVSIPPGSWVFSTDVTYTMTQNLGATSLQLSFLECTSTGISEPSAIPGPTTPVTNPFPVVYNRTGLTIANGPSATGQVKFYLHALRQGFATCGSFVAFVPNNSWTVTVNYGPAPVCPPPASFASPLQGPGSVDLTWGGSAVSYDIEYGFAGFPQGTGTVVNTTANSITINGLTPLVPYQFYIRSNCGANGLSAWAGPLTATALCLPVSAPYVQTFEVGFTSQQSTSSAGILDPCFSRDATQNYYWEVGPPSFSVFNTGPSGDHTTGAGKYLFVNPDNIFNTPTATYVQTPFIDLSAITSPELVFWYHMFGSGINNLQVQVVKNGILTTALTLSGQQQTTKTSAWKRAVVDLAAFGGDTIQIRFVGNRNTGFSFNSQSAIDDLSIDEKSTCTTIPTALTASNITPTQVQLAWTSAATNWLIKYFPQNAGPGAAQFVAAATNPFTVTGLIPATNYVFEVSDSCGAGSVGLGSLPVSATTACGPIPAPYFENFSGVEWVSPTFFNDTGLVSQCWRRSNTTQFFWRPGTPASTPFTLTGPNSDHTTGNGKFLFTRSVGAFGNTTTQTSISSAFIDLTPLDTPELRFWYHLYGANIDELDVLIRVGTATPVPVLNLSGQQQTSKAAAWNEAIIDLTPFMDDTIRIVFRARRVNSTTATEMAIDDILIQEKPDCPKPLSFQNTWVGANGAAFNWNDPGGTSWIIEYGPPGFTPGTGTSVNVTSPTDTIFGLTPGTTYAFYITRVCGANPNWRGPRTVTTLPCNDACFYTLDMTSTFFNGWQGTIVRLSSGTYFQDYTLTSNVAQTISFPVCDGQPVSLSIPVVGFSTFPVGFVFKSDQGTTLYSHTAGSTLNTGVLFSILGACGGLCEAPTNLTLTGVTGTSGTISWASGGSSWVEYGPVGFAPGTGTLVPGPSTSPLTINGLTPNTSYQVYIQDSCASPPISQRVGPLSFTTLNCVPVTATASLTTTNLSVAASAAASPAIQSYTWDFGDGTVLTGATANHTYLADGTYTVKLVVVNPCGGSDTSSQIITVCSALGTANLTTNAAGLSVGFVGTISVGTPVQYIWNFGDNTSGSGPTPNHVYALDGTYTVTLTIVNLCGDSAQVTTTLQVCAPVQGQFTLNQVQNNITVDAWATPGAAGLNFTWDFGDGTTGSGPVASHGYSAAGTYTVTMTATNQCGASYSFTKTVKICTPPIVAFTFKIISTSGNGMLVEFDASASQGGNGYLWNFGDGNTSTVGPIVQHLYLTPGLFYVVKLTLTDTCGTTISDTKALSSLGTEANLNEHTIVYPNPVSGNVLFVEGPVEEVERLNIITLQGVLLPTSYRKEESTLIIELQEIPVGTYILEMETSEGVIRKRFIRSAP